MDANQEAIAKKAVKALKARIEVVNRHLEPLLSAPLSETYGKLPVNEKAKLQVLLSYTINSLFYMYLKTQGVFPQEHPVATELARIRTYIEKIKKAEGKGPKPSMQVDKGAAARFIKAALAEDEEEEENAGTKRKAAKEEEEESSRVDAVQNSKQNKKRARMDPFAGYSKK
ncbi:hypothetical protein LRAMOSA09963 [Lichtheimia ramosa]|uniref:Exosome complex protein n=1 Tax=Lichtheimia ramosa TaxID=688394 RepID=A0A077WPE8_9FUNG|nr:hypothetical protein LRAMOSA09963 [Lichtheimia ramosa]